MSEHAGPEQPAAQADSSSAHATSRAAWEAARGDGAFGEDAFDTPTPARGPGRSGDTVHAGVRRLGAIVPDLPSSGGVLEAADPRLTDALRRGGIRYASLAEYAAGTGIDPADVIEQLAAHLESGSVALEVAGGELFLHTAPMGRPRPDGLQVAANLWEALRERHDPESAATLWRQVRSLQRAGWQVETRRTRALVNLAQGYAGLEMVDISLDLGDLLVPVVHSTTTQAIASPQGVLADLDAAGAVAAAVCCPTGQLDAYATAVRLWQASNVRRVRMHVLLLEAPQYPVVLLTTADAGVLPRAITRLAPQEG